MKMFTGSVSFAVSALAFFAASVAAVDLQPSNSEFMSGSTFGAMDFLKQTANPARAFETNGNNLRAFLLNRNRNPGVDTIAIIDLRKDDQYNRGYIRDSIRFPMADGDQGYYIYEMQNGQIPEPLDLPQVQQAKYVVFYCQAGGSRSPAMARSYFNHIVMQNLPGVRPNQKVVLLSKGFEEFELDPRNAPLIRSRPTFVSIGSIQPDEPESPSDDPFRHDRPGMISMSGVQPDEPESPSDMSGSSRRNEGGFSDWQQKMDAHPKKVAKRFTA